jgi:hypothetical protein
MNTSHALHKTLAILALLSAAGAARAQTFVWNNAAGGPWNNALNWTPNTVPNAGTHIAEIGVAGSYAVDLSINPSLLGLTITNSGATLRVLGGTGLTLVGPSLANAGAIIVNPAAINAGTFIQCNADCAFTGTGILQLNAFPGNIDAAYLQTGGAARITNAAGHTISGNGRVYALLTNNGVISTSGSGNQLQYSGSAKVNNNLIRAQNLATTVMSIGLTQGPSGVLRADNATTSIGGITVTGGRIEAINGGVTTIAGAPSFDVAASTGPLNLPGGSSITFVGAGHRHDGVITVNSNAVNAGTFLQFNANGTLRSDTTTCQVVLNASTGNLDSSILQTGGAAVLTVDPTCTISGFGRVYANLVNNSTISTSGAGKQIQYLGSAKTNNGLFLAHNGATNTVSIAVSQGASGVIRADNATNSITGVALSGGRLEATNGGTTVISGTPSFNIAASAGPLNVPAGSGITFLGAGHRHDGVITVNSNAVNAGTFLQFNANGTLRSDTTTCQVVLNAFPNNLDTAIIQTAGGAVLTIAPTCTITGHGNIHASIVNNSTIATSGAGKQIQYLGSAKTNNGLFLAQSGATNTVSIAISQGASGVIRADNATNSIAGIALTGGRLEATNGGTTVISGAPSFNIAASAGPLNVPAGSGITFLGAGHRHDGVITVNSNAANAGTFLQFNTTGTLRSDTTTCRVVLNANSANLDSSYIVTGGAAVLTIDPTCTITGHGNIHASIVNNSTITTSGAGKQIQYLGFSKTNNGLLLAQNGAANTVSIAVSQGASGVIRADNATNSIAGIALTGGRLEAINGGTTVISGVPSFNIAASRGPLNLPGGSGITFLGSTHRHDGAITVNSNAANAGTYLQFNVNAILRGDSGACQIVLNATPANLDSAYLQTGGNAVLSIDPTTTISGRGRIYARTNIAGTVAPGFSPSTTAPIEGRNAIEFSDSARLEIKVAGTGAGQFDRLTNSNSVVANGTLAVTLLPSYTPVADDAFVILSGSILSGTFDTLQLPALDEPLLKLAVRYTTSQAILFVTCKGNFNSDEITDFFDYLDFVAAFSSEDPSADINGDNQVDFFDYLDFVSLLDACGA